MAPHATPRQDQGPQERRRHRGHAAAVCLGGRQAKNAQVAVCFSYAGRGGHALIDRELCLSASWTAHPARYRAAGIHSDMGISC